jgi:hypothetical protein
MAEGVRFDMLFRRHLEAEVSMSFVVAICFVRWFPRRLSVFIWQCNSLVGLSSFLARPCMYYVFLLIMEHMPRMFSKKL